MGLDPPKSTSVTVVKKQQEVIVLSLALKYLIMYAAVF